MRNHRWLLLLGITALAGCAGRVFTEENNRQTIQVDVGSTFSISVPAPKTRPSSTGSILELTGEKPQDNGRVLFDFQAKALGESEIKIPPDFSLRVRVVSASDRPTMMHRQ